MQKYKGKDENEMSERRWTDSQKRAIDHRGSDLLLSAAAGSGKTATLTARLTSLLTSSESDVTPSQVLAVTFTNAACAEMRDRLFASALDMLKNDPGNKKARELVTGIDSVKICTMDSFCISVIRPHFAAFGLPANFRVADSTELELLRKRAMKDTVDMFFESEDGDFLLLADCLSNERDEDSVDEALLALMSTLTQKNVGEKELYRYADRLYEIAPTTYWNSHVASSVKEEMRLFTEHYTNAFRSFTGKFTESDKIREKYVPECDSMTQLLERISGLSDSGEYDKLRELVTSYKFSMFRPLGEKNQTDATVKFHKLRRSFKEEFEKKLQPRFLWSEEEILTTCKKTASCETGLAKLTGEYTRRFSEMKRERGIVDFDDVNKMATELLIDTEGNPTAAARKIGERYRYIFIDEYQDTNRTQDAIFKSISHDAERFMVGDIKQSIYSFRGAEPEIFARYRMDFSQKNGGEYIFMSDNFRSSRAVLDFANDVSERTFKYSSMPYGEEDKLRFGRAEEGTEQCEIVLVDKNGDDSDDDSEEEENTKVRKSREAEYVARRVSQILKHQRKPNGDFYTPEDIAILVRKNSEVEEFSSALENIGVTSQKNIKQNVLDSEEVLTLLCILHSVSNPVLDIYLAGAMKSSVFGFSLEDTVKIRLAYPDGPLYFAVREYSLGELGEKCRVFINTLDSLRERASFLSAELYIRSVISTLSLELRLSDDEKSAKTVRHNLNEFCSLAASAGKSGFLSLFQFLDYVERTPERSQNGAKEAPRAEGAVSVMTVHQSKGLEFPICFLCGCAKNMHSSMSRETTVFDPEIGLGLMLPDESTLVRCDNGVRRGVMASLLRRSTEEEMRVLYVAMTRAREKLIVTAQVKDSDLQCEQTGEELLFDGEYKVLTAPSVISWILPAVISPDSKNSVRIITDTSLEAENESDTDRESDDILSDEESTELGDILSQRFSYQYPYDYLKKIPAKLTVSRLYPEILDEDESAADAGSEDIDFGEEAPRPEFMSRLSSPKGNDIGTATHVFMQFCDFERLLREGAQAELSRLSAEGFLSREMSGIVDISLIEEFRKSSFFARMTESRRMERELRFNSLQGAEKFTSDTELGKKLAEENVKLTVQGVIDAVFEDKDGKLVLVDYKTDRFSPNTPRDTAIEILKERHRNQLSYYRDICGEIFGRKVDETYIYSLTLGEAIEI